MDVLLVDLRPRTRLGLGLSGQARAQSADNLPLAQLTPCGVHNATDVACLMPRALGEASHMFGAELGRESSFEPVMLRKLLCLAVVSHHVGQQVDQ